MRADQCFRLSDDISFGFVHDHSHREEIPSSHLVSSETKLSHSRPSLFLLLVLLLLGVGVGVGVGVRVHRRHLFRRRRRRRRRRLSSGYTKVSTPRGRERTNKCVFFFPGLFGRDASALHKATKKPRQPHAKKRRVCVIYIYIYICDALPLLLLLLPRRTVFCVWGGARIYIARVR